MARGGEGPTNFFAKLIPAEVSKNKFGLQIKPSCECLFYSAHCDVEILNGL
jgi:hypothetical protein